MEHVGNKMQYLVFIPTNVEGAKSTNQLFKCMRMV